MYSDSAKSSLFLPAFHPLQGHPSQTFAAPSQFQWDQGGWYQLRLIAERKPKVTVRRELRLRSELFQHSSCARSFRQDVNVVLLTLTHKTGLNVRAPVKILRENTVNCFIIMIMILRGQ